jgi:fibro-slime domain-containing protein
VQVTSAATFAEWYNDIPGTNQSFEYEFELLPEGSGRYVFESSAFFPIDGLGFGDEGSRDMMGGLHNFHFTTEIHTRFQYRGGESFTFVGDDDLWLFINGRLAIDLGGLHARETASVNLDAQAAELGITPGETYTMDIFHAERHTFDSNFRIETSIECFELI